MTDGLSADVTETLAALDRLVHRHKVLTLDQARAAARIITGNPDFDFSPAPSPPPSAPGPTDNASPEGSESL